MIYVLRLQQQLPIEHEKNKIIYSTRQEEDHYKPIKGKQSF